MNVLISRSSWTTPTWCRFKLHLQSIPRETPGNLQVHPEMERLPDPATVRARRDPDVDADTNIMTREISACWAARYSRWRPESYNSPVTEFANAMA